MNRLTRKTSPLQTAAKALRALIAVAVGTVLTFAFFLLLPKLQTVGRPPDKSEIRAIGTTALPPPPAAEEEPPPVEEEEQKPPPMPELAESAPPMDLSQLELALEGGAGGGGGGVGDVLARLPGTRESMAGEAQKDEEQVFSLADLDQPPKAVHQPAPEFPAELRRRKTEGSVSVLFIVDRGGRVENPIVQKSSHPALEQPALQAVRRWRFEPGRRNGQAVPFRMRVPISFISR